MPGCADKVAELYLGGMSVTDISAQVGCSKEYVHKIRRKRGIPPQHPRITGQAMVRIEVARRYQAGESVDHLATSMRLPKTSIYRCLRIEDVPLRPQVSTKVLEALSAEIIAKYEGGRSLDSVAEDYGCSAGGVRNLLLRHNVTLRPSSPRFIEFTADEQAHIIAMRDGGARVHDIAKEFRRDPSVVTRFLEGVGRGGRVKQPKVIGSGGYVYVRDESGQPVLEHRKAMADALGRALHANETVHHVNGDITNNALSNLQLRQGNHGKGVVMQCLDCHSHNVKPVELASV